MKKGKPSFEEIKDDLYPKCKKLYGEKLFPKFEEDQKYYELDFQSELNLPVEFADEGIVLPTARDFVDVFVDHIDIANARVFVNRKGTSNISLEDAEMMRKFYLGLIHRTNVESDISPWRVAAKHYALHGLTILKTVWDADRWPDKPAQKENESEDAYAKRIDEWRSQTHESLPIVIQAISPRCVMPDPSYGGRMFVIEEHKKIALDVSKRWPHWRNPNGKNAGDEVDFVSYWDDTYRCDFIDGEPILKVKGGVAKHNYGFIPYVFIDSGLGNISYDARPEMRYVGILRYIMDLLISESRDYSISDVVLKREAWPWYSIEGENANLVTEVDQYYGKGNRLPSGTSIEFKTPQVPPEALNQHLYRTADYLAAHAAPRSVRGLSESGVRSGADRRLVIAEASARYRYSEDAFRNGTAKVLTNCARLLKNVIPGDVRVWARTPTDEFDDVIKKEKMKEPFTCYVEFAPISEEDEYRRHDDLRQLIAGGIITKRWARTQMSNVDPIAMEKQERKELLRQLPSYNQVLDQYLAAKAGEALGGAGGAGGAQVGEQLTPREVEAGRRLVPPIPQRAPLGSAQETQNQLKAARRPVPTYPGQGEGGGGAR